MKITEYIDAPGGLSAKAQETCRLLDTLKYYDWLDRQGINWDDIRGITKVGGARLVTTLSLKLRNGATVTLDAYPPFPDAVIFNRRYYCEDGGPTVPENWSR